MNVFSVKSIGLYSLAIGSAIVFFNFVTSYGEANIKAPIAIAGNYLITAQKLPDCLQGKQLLLKLQQSGIYLNASLINQPKESIANKDISPTFSGRLHARELDLVGLLPTAICPRSLQLRIVGSLAEPTMQLQGKLWFGSQESAQITPVEFIGALQPSTRSAQAH
jgi:hypothetical protein